MRNRILLIIEELELTQKQFSEEIGITAGGLTDFFKGRSKDLSSSTVKNIVIKYNINPAWLLTGEGEMFNKPSDVKDGKVSYTAISDINEITRTRWFKNLIKEQREIITNCSTVKDKDLLKKVSGIISRQAAKEEGDRELEELDRGLQEK